MKNVPTPLMQQYEQIKSVHPNEIVLFRLGDFYEMFGDDAKSAAPVMELLLTQRQGVPMCGIPYHAAERYLAKLLKGGFRVAIAEQMEDPSESRGLVKREVVRTISAGTVVEEKFLNERSNNFLVAIAWGEDSEISLAALDISTGQLLLSEIGGAAAPSNLENELARISPVEILFCAENHAYLSAQNGVPVQFLEKEAFRNMDLAEFFQKRVSLSQLTELKKCQPTSDALKMVLHYARKMNPATIANIQSPEWSSSPEIMSLDSETIASLEILKNSLDGTTAKTLLSFLDKTLSPMGGRLLKQWLVRPLIRLEKIRERIQRVDFFLQESLWRKSCRETLKGISDLERIAAKIVSGLAGPRDLIALKLSLAKAQVLRGRINRTETEDLNPVPNPSAKFLPEVPDWSETIRFVQSAIADDPPIYLENGGVIRAGYDASLDEKRKAAEEGKSWLEDLEKREKVGTQIANLKIGYTSVFGYYLEVTKTHLSKVPPEWHRKQTLVNAERFVNEELKVLEQKILGAEEQSVRIERELFQKIIEALRGKTSELQKTARAIAELDCTLSLAEVAEVKKLVKPEMDESDVISIIEGWHPVVKEFLPPGLFVPNDTCLDGNQNQIMILTGPNMSGKSTYLRQTALTVLMAQMGSFVPAKAARIGIVDRVFTRIGSADRLAQGESTFMVEMQETSRILNRATGKSLIILDEVGRGTSTYDGISIAWAVIEHLAATARTDSPKIHPKAGASDFLPRPKVLFATHYFELTHLTDKIEGVKNFNVQAKEWQDSVIFLHKVVPGPADRSYGIHVAQLAGLPPALIRRAKKIMSHLEENRFSALSSTPKAQTELFSFPQPDD